MLRYPNGMAERQPDPGSPGNLQGDLGWMLGVVFRAYVKASDHALRDLPRADVEPTAISKRDSVIMHSLKPTGQAS